MNTDWATALEELSASRIERVPKGCITQSEFGKLLGCSSTIANKRIRELMGAGLAEIAGKFRIQAGSRILAITHYRLLKKK